MKNVPLTHLINLEYYAPELIPSVLAEFADNGAKHISLGSKTLIKLCQDHAHSGLLYGWFKKSPVKPFECHGIWGGAGYDLNITDYPRRKGMIEDHKQAMEWAVMYGSKTYVVHMGAADCYWRDTTLEKMRELTIEALEQLVPHAEKLGLIIALENSFEPSNTPDEVLYFLNHFKTDTLGCCLDVGHMNLMAKTPGKDPSKYVSYMNLCWKNGIVEQENAFEKLAPHIVTCHLHDNDGYSDAHNLPGTGTIDWATLMHRIKTECPRLISLQSEVSYVNHGISIRKLCETMDKINNL
jgi:sugar phosphate isomerase/epimerase